MKNKLVNKLLILALSALLGFGGILETGITAFAEESSSTESTKKKKNKDDDDDEDDVDDAAQYLRLLDNYQTPTVSYDQDVFIALPFANFSAVPLRNVVVTAEISNLVSEWPFVPDAAGSVSTIRNFPAYDRDKDIHDLRQDIGFSFHVREDVKTGYYPLKFNITYNRDEITETSSVIAYVHTLGKEESGYLDEINTNVSKPRIIVTGFETNPGDVYAGDTFNLTIHMKNTSSTAKVSNILFDLKSEEKGEDSDTTFAAFLPTSGANSIYVDEMAPGSSQDINIELSAKSDLAQKPYALDINIKYDTNESFDLTDKASLSIPILQAQRCETGDAELSPDAMTIGEQSNITFDVYNTGKTTLYNVWVKFDNAYVSGGDTFLGTISSGKTGSVDAMVDGMAANEGTLTAYISYENESGKITTIEKTLNLTISEAVEENWSDDGMMDGGEVEEVTPEKSFPWVWVVVGGIVALIVILVVVSKVKKAKAAKKEAAELEAEVEALE